MWMCVCVRVRACLNCVFVLQLEKEFLPKHTGVCMCILMCFCLCMCTCVCIRVCMFFLCVFYVCMRVCILWVCMVRVYLSVYALVSVVNGASKRWCSSCKINLTSFWALSWFAGLASSLSYTWGGHGEASYTISWLANTHLSWYCTNNLGTELAFSFLCFIHSNRTFLIRKKTDTDSVNTTGMA
jgi:hypothetical protein